MYSGPNLLSGHFYWFFILTFSPLEGALTMMVYGRCWSLWCLKCMCGCLLGGRFSNHGVQLWQAPWVLRKRTVTLTQKTSHLFSPKRHFRQPTVKDWTRGGKYLLHTLDLCFLVHVKITKKHEILKHEGYKWYEFDSLKKLLLTASLFNRKWCQVSLIGVDGLDGFEGLIKQLMWRFVNQKLL